MVAKCVKAILEKVGGGGGGGSNRSERPPREDSGEGESITIEPGMVGRIVGKAGATIQQFQTDFDVKIDISKDDDPVRISDFFPLNRI